MTIYEVWPTKDWRYCGYLTREQAESCLKEAKDCGYENAEIKEAEVLRGPRDINMDINEEKRSNFSKKKKKKKGELKHG